eukprot:jgi/Bigna1/38264/e_gw1.24.123.1
MASRRERDLREPPRERERRPPPDTSRLFSLKVDNLSFRTRPEDLKETFGKFGTVADVHIPRDRYTGESRGFGFVRFERQGDADDAAREMDGYKLDARRLKVQMAKYKKPAVMGGGSS